MAGSAVVFPCVLSEYRSSESLVGWRAVAQAKRNRLLQYVGQRVIQNMGTCRYDDWGGANDTCGVRAFPVARALPTEFSNSPKSWAKPTLRSYAKKNAV